MSRIEQAMEKAARARKALVTPEAKGAPEQAAPSTVHIPPQPVTITEKIDSASHLLVNLSDPHSPVGEEYRKLKSALVKLTKQDAFNNTVMVTSSVPNEGKSITALNLAISLAQELDHTVLLIDADLRRPSAHRYLNMKQQTGFAECLMGEADIGDAITGTGIGRLSVLTAGREVPNPVELFSSRKMQALLEEMKHRYSDRYLIFDTPPVLPFAETRTLGNLVDGVLFVVKERTASQANIREALEALKGCNMLGLVYNDTIPDLKDERYSAYRGYAPYKR